MRVQLVRIFDYLFNTVKNSQLHAYSQILCFLTFRRTCSLYFLPSGTILLFWMEGPYVLFVSLTMFMQT